MENREWRMVKGRVLGDSLFPIPYSRLLLAHIQHQAVILDHVAVARGDLVLQALDFFARELDDLARLDVDHVVVVLAAVELVDGLAALEVVLEHDAGGFELGQHAVDGGEADVVLVLEQLAVDVLGRGRRLRFDPRLGPAGANVNFVAPGAAGADPWLIRTYERGVEGETLACGTGTVAAALALADRGEAALPMRFRTRGGPELLVRARVAGRRALDAWLGGQGRLLFEGRWEGI